MIDKAWRAVTPLTIHSCFKNSDFLSPNLVDVDDTLTEFNAEPSLWEAFPEQDLMFDDYVLVGTDIAVWGALTDAEIMDLDHNNTISDEDELEELTPVALSEAKVSLNKLRNFSLQNHVDADILQASFVLEKSVDKDTAVSEDQNDQNLVSSSSQETAVTYAAVGVQTENMVAEQDASPPDKGTEENVDKKNDNTCDCSAKYEILMKELHDRLEQEHKEDKDRALQELSEKGQIEVHEIHHSKRLNCMPVSCSFEHHTSDRTIWLSLEVVREVLPGGGQGPPTSFPSTNLTRRLVA
ncbi:zinc finger MYND domain-containing protein 11 [Trichonephila clavipes]|nr:zinc finger MYND domain-containing protein 11 [Trichonephila clavipes]